MHYVCIENNVITSILNYVPNVPDSVSVVEISDNDHAALIAQTHTFDVTTKTIIAVDASITNQKIKDQADAIEREFLNSTDWKILRHLRQHSLSILTSLTEEEYIILEQQRQAASARIG